jgi:ATP-dependent DNA helicase PIF1
MNMIPSNSQVGFRFQRRQFPIVVSFAMTINKSQGQTLARVGLLLTRHVFSHGQLYVALSQVKSRNGLKILIVDDNGHLTSSTKNVVYHEVLQKIFVS